MAIDKLIPQYLTSDTDQKLVKSVEMTDNLNVRVSNDAEGTAGVIKNVKGTEVVSAKTAQDAFPAGDNRVVGSASNEKNKEVIFLVWNQFKNHGIYRIDLSTGKYQKLYQDSILNFSKFGYCDCDTLINEDDETLFYWTDNFNPPMKVNVNRLIKSDYPASLYSGTNEQKLLNLTVAKQPPLYAPSFNIVNNPDVEYNNIRDKVFQFAYRYKYVDGEISALSEYSASTASISQLKDGIVDSSALDFFNQVDIFIRHSPGDVEKIQLFAREGNQGAFFEVDEIDNNGTSGVTIVEFRNDKLTSALSLDEVNKTYDNVPQAAQAQAIVGGRLMYGNYKEGYPNVNVDVTATATYKEKPQFYHIKEKIYPTNSSYTLPTRTVTTNSNTKFDIGLDFSSLPSVIPAGSTVYIDATIVSTQLIVTEGPNNYLDLFVAYKFSKDLNGAVRDIFDTKSPSISEYNLPVEAINIKKEVTFSSAISKNDAIVQIANAIASDKYTSVINADADDKDQATEITNRSRVWMAGVSYFKLEKSTLINDVQIFNLYFGGAEVYAKALTVEVPVSDLGLVGSLLGDFELEVEVVRSPAIKIGGMINSNLVIGGVITGEAEFRVAGFAGNSSYMAQFIDGYKSFKENASHKLGVVYFDDRGRAGGVNKIPSVFVQQLANREDRLSASIDLRLLNNPPSWARKWQLVYAKNTKYEKFLQYSVSNALPSKNGVDEKIYVSTSTLEGKPQSYKEKTSARLEYKYQQGDRLRIIRYYDSATDQYVYPVNYEFDILGYEYVSDAEEGPFIPKPSYKNSQTGWFLVLENRNIGDFGYEKVLSNDDLWNENVLVEMYTPAKEVEDAVYYGKGKMYNITNGKHEGDRSVTVQPTVTINILTALTASSSNRLYVGDKLTVGGVQITIIRVKEKLDGTYDYDFIFNFTNFPPSTGTYTVAIDNYEEAAINTTQGDVYFRVRKIRKPNSFYDQYFLDEKFQNNTYAYDVDYIEDISVSDFFVSNATSLGKPYAHLPEAKTIRRKASITYSDMYVIDSDRLNLSSFNLSLANWTDLDIKFGSIQAMINRGDTLTTLQDSKASQVPVNRNLLEYTSGDAGVSVSRNILGAAAYYAGDYGTKNPESVVDRFGVVYYVDVNAGKVLRLSSDGITPISEKGMDSFFNDKFASLIPITNKIRVAGGFDPDNDEYLITVEPVYNTDLTVGSDVYDYWSDINGEFIIAGITYTSSTVLWNNWGNLWNTYCGDWDDVGNGIVFVDSMFNTQAIFVDSSFAGTTGTINVLVTDSSFSFSAIGQLDLSTGQLVLPPTTCEGDDIVQGDPILKLDGFTIAYKHKDGVWSSKYSFRPTAYENVNNDLYSFFDGETGLVWKHNVNETRNNFYGQQYSSMFEVVSNYNPSMIKTYEAVGVEGDGTWSSVMENSKQQTTITTSDFSDKEGHSYAMIPRDTLISSSHQIYLGKVESIGADTVTFTTPVNRLPFVVGDTLKTAVGSNLTGTGMEVSGITDRKTVQCTTGISNISVGDNVFVEHSSRIDGDPMRDVYLKIKMSSSDTTPFEVHAVSVSFDRSRLHNDRVN